MNSRQVQISEYTDHTAQFIVTDKTMTLAQWNAQLAASPLVVVYPLKTPVTQILSRPVQDKLNGIPAFKGTNHVYTMVDNPNLAPKLNVRFEVGK